MEATSANKSGTTVPSSVGPPLILVVVGILSLVTSAALLFTGGGASIHLLGYLTGAIVPILVIGIARRVDLDRRTSPDYIAHGLFGLAILVLTVGAVITAALHIWPLATEWAS